MPAPRADSQTPMLYSVRTAPITARYLVIEELERSGRRNRLGPFPVGDLRLERLLERVESRLERTGAQDTALTPRLRVRGLKRREAHLRALGALRREERRAPLVATSLKIETAGSGIATVPRSQLLALGLPSDVVLSRAQAHERRPQRRLPRDGPRPARRRRSPSTPSALETPYTSQNVYVLTWSGAGAAPRRPAVARGRCAPSDLRARGPAGDLRRERAAGHRSLALGPAAPGSGPWPYDWDPDAGSFELPGWPATSGPMPVRLRFQGMTDHHHRASVTLNGESLGAVAFEGVGAGYLEATAASLKPTGNELKIEYTTDEDDPNAYAYLDYFEAQRPLGFVPQPVAATARPFDDSVPGRPPTT